MKSITVRMDDICSTMDYEKFIRCYKILDEANVKPLLAVVPFSKDPKLERGQVEYFWELMNKLQADGCEVAVHGYHHIYTTQEQGLVCTRLLSEFAGVPYDEQLKMLKAGKLELEKHGLRVDTFCAPGHSYDRNTLKAMKEAGYQYLSDGRSRHPYYLEGIKCIPADDAYRLHKFGILTICLHSNEETEVSMDKLKLFLKTNCKKLCDFREMKDIATQVYWMARIDEKFTLFMRSLGRRMILAIKNRTISKR